MKLPKNKSFIFFIVSFVMFSMSVYNMLDINNHVRAIETSMLPNTYIAGHDVSSLSLDSLSKKLDEIDNEITNKKIMLFANSIKLEYRLKDLGIHLDKEKIINSINQYNNNIDYWDLYNSYSKDNFDRIDFDYSFAVDETRLKMFLRYIKMIVDNKPSKGKLVYSEDKELKYTDYIVGHSLNIDKNIDIIKNNFSTIDYDDSLTLAVDETFDIDEYLASINTKISSFSTKFDNTVTRKYNLITGASYINGTILNPGDTFSFYEAAGPYNKEGYVRYLGLMGNGVCQVATTVYNAELLAGLKTITRYNHAIKSTYVDGGLDATVATDVGFITDLKFQNTLSYPIYIAAYVENDTLTVEMWSNEKATGGKTYTTESVRLGYGAYDAFRHVYQDGTYVNTENLGRTYYTKE